MIKHLSLKKSMKLHNIKGLHHGSQSSSLI